MTSPQLTESQRILEEYRRREREIDAERYAPWNPAELFMRTTRARLAVAMLHEAGVFPEPGDPCLEVGYGRLGWLGELVAWGLRVEDLHGIELDAIRAALAQEALPGADLRVGDAAECPWPDGSFRVVIASTVLTSVLDHGVRQKIAGEIVRVLIPGGGLLWYDFARNNPRNPNVRGVPRREIRKLFPQLEGKIRSLTLAPPLARLLAARSWWLASILEAFPVLRTHLMAVLVKAQPAND